MAVSPMASACSTVQEATLRVFLSPWQVGEERQRLPASGAQ